MKQEGMKETSKKVDAAIILTQEANVNKVQCQL